MALPIRKIESKQGGRTHSATLPAGRQALLLKHVLGVSGRRAQRGLLLNGGWGRRFGRFFPMVQLLIEAGGFSRPAAQEVEAPTTDVTGSYDLDLFDPRRVKQ